MMRATTGANCAICALVLDASKVSNPVGNSIILVGQRGMPHYIAASPLYDFLTAILTMRKRSLSARANARKRPITAKSKVPNAEMPPCTKDANNVSRSPFTTNIGG